MAPSQVIPMSHDELFHPSSEKAQSQKEQLMSILPSKGVSPLWTQMNAMVPPAPSPQSVPQIWRYDDLRPYLLESGRLVHENEAERRVLMLVNKTMGAPYTTDTLYAGLQLIKPGETAPAHRHQAFALRFIIEGEDGFTAVEGQKISMSVGDVILTPKWAWHDHGHEGTGPMIWLDGLDLPVYQNLPVNFAEPYKERRYPSTPVEGSPLKFPFASVVPYLHPKDGEVHRSSASHTYRFPDGSHVSNIIAAHAFRVDAGAITKRRRETASYVFHAYKGSGKTVLESPNGEKQVISWKEKDTFAVPSWYWVEHFASTKDAVELCEGEGRAAYLFAFSDVALLEGLGLYRMEFKDQE